MTITMGNEKIEYFDENLVRRPIGSQQWWAIQDSTFRLIKIESHV